MLIGLRRRRRLTRRKNRYSWRRSIQLPLPLPEDTVRGWKPHHLFRGRTPSLDFLSCHASVLSGGHSPHLPHAHPEEEVLIVLDGAAELVTNDRPKMEGAHFERLQAESFVYYPPHQHHTIRNSGSAPITYLMFKWRAGASRARQPLATSIFCHADVTPDKQKPIWERRLFEGPTRNLHKLSSHVTVVQPGATYEPHVDSL